MQQNNQYCRINNALQTGWDLQVVSPSMLRLVRPGQVDWPVYIDGDEGVGWQGDGVAHPGENVVDPDA